MTKTHLILPALALATLAAACATRPSVRLDHDPSVDMKSYTSFGFMDHLATDRAGYSTLLTDHLKKSTRAQLERLGYVYDEDNAQLRVNFFVKVAERQEIRSTGTGGPGFYGYRFGRYAAWGGYGLETVDYKAGTLGVDLVDARRKALVWQGVAEGRLGSRAERDPAAATDKALAEIFRGFPGGRPGKP